MNNWINTKERLPDDYLFECCEKLCSNGKYIFIAQYIGQGKFIHADVGLVNVTHWIELPEMPETENGWDIA
jgi:Protein of unknown function (DUF551)